MIFTSLLSLQLLHLREVSLTLQSDVVLIILFAIEQCASFRLVLAVRQAILSTRATQVRYEFVEGCGESADLPLDCEEYLYANSS